jgi:hypothetical protein
MPTAACLYMDDSGTRNPNRKADTTIFRDWFALGGIMINEEDEPTAEKAHDDFCQRWNITYPLHSVRVRHREGSFSWLRKISQPEYARFMEDLTNLLIGLPVAGHGCVIDRPGYNARYRDKYGRQTWMLCKTAFSVVCERAAKRARDDGRKLRVLPEQGDKTADNHVRSYYSDLRSIGMPFADVTSAKYAPLGAADLKDSLYELRFKNKSSRMAQLADLYLYPIARGRYEPTYRPYVTLRAHKKLIDDHLESETMPHLGIKYSCFDLVDAPKTQEPETSSGSGAAPVTGTS